ncbi:hypothetical protein [Candidatus Nardonella dryophthoridicola]|uniref:Uncharacterized protein n=1 Tax=endosymbiont of Metamasius hemipterus TaxID=204627 RepID=A0ABT0TW94_9GAMM|nr:hypothetical protein [Candidatus Nardonella dryophthoridicola]MCM0158260.1 hypothetical protein [endosymbiont of Metamasius hemipterus]
MNNKKIITILEIGTYKIICIIAEIIDNLINIKSFGESKSNGIENGNIINLELLFISIKM